MWHKHRFRLVLAECIHIMFAIVFVEGAGEPCSLALHDNTIDIGNGNCTCAPGYYQSHNAVGSTLTLAETSRWWCEPCEAGFFKTGNGLSACLPCDSDHMWSAVGQAECVKCGETSMLTLETKHTRCIPCPSSIITLLAYVDLKHVRNVAVRAQDGQTLLLSAANVAQFAQHFFIDEAVCCLPAMMSDVSSMLRPRTICPAGTKVNPPAIASQASAQDPDATCQDCGFGEYSDTTGALVCQTVTKCLDARFRDSTGIAYATTARKINSKCELDWLQDMVSVGRHPYVATGEYFKFHDQRHSLILGYSTCAGAYNIKCTVLGANRCQFDFLDSWKQGLVPLNNQQSTPCQYRCADGYYVLNSRCTACAVGTYKLGGTAELQTCSQCAAGKHAPSPASLVCVSCGIGKFSSFDRSMCISECQSNTFYSKGHLCYPVSRSYIIELSGDLRTQRINVQECPAVSGQQSAQLTPWGEGVARIFYAGTGETYCQVSSACATSEIWDTRTETCKPCAIVTNAHSNSFEHGCVPQCRPGFFVVPREGRTAMTAKFICKPCENSFAAFRREKCDDNAYLNDTCTAPNQNTPCLPCSNVQQAYQVLDTLQVSLLAYDKAGRCKFRCRDVQYVGTKAWYYIDKSMVAGMLGLDLAAFEQRLATDNVPQAAKVCADGLHVCVRTQVPFPKKRGIHCAVRPVSYVVCVCCSFGKHLCLKMGALTLITT